MRYLTAVLAVSLISSLGFGASITSLPVLTTEGHMLLRSVPVDPGLTPGLFRQDIDHTGLLPGQTFNQRYWVDNEYASNSASAPVIYHICGEGDAEQAYFLHDNAIAWAKALGAHLVWLEHRYYGQSLPFSDLSSEHLQYLTLNNELEDLATFQKWISAQNGWTGPWLTVGGSYSGTISALYRLKHPELVVGALAASAPMISGVGQDEGSQDDVDSLSSIDPSSDTGDRQWAYQSCTTFGFWLAAAEGPDAPLFEPSTWLCQQVFGNAPHFNPTVYNQNYYQPFLTGSAPSASHVLFTYGSEDVWTQIGLPVNGVTNPNITVHLIEGAGHHFDLNYPSSDDSPDVVSARQLFLNLARSWLQKSEQ